MKAIRRSSYMLFLSLAIGTTLMLTAAGPGATGSPAAKAPSESEKARVGAATSAADPAPKPAAPAAAQASPDPAVTGEWVLQAGVSTVDNSWAAHPLPIHISLLPNGKLLFWGREKRTVNGQIYDDYGHTTARVWDPFYKIFTEVNLEGAGEDIRTKTNLFCSGHSFLPDGRLLVAGGHRTADEGEYGYGPDHLLDEGMGSKNINIFDFRTNTWTPGPVMNQGRWYPFNVTLANGETLIVSGSHFSSFSTPTQVITEANRIPQIYGLQGALRNVKDIDVALGTGGGHFIIANYPLLHLLSDGRVSVAVAGGNGLQNFILTPSPVDGEGFWQSAPSQKLVHGKGTAVMYQKDKALFPAGASGRTTQNEAEILEMQPGGALSWTLVNSMTHKRVYHTSTVLPDGKVLVTGGTTCNGTNKINCAPGGAVKTPELWDPQAGSWTQMAQHQEVRVYHSTAILLPDARVLVGGGGRPAAEGETPTPTGAPCLTPTSTTPATSACREFGHNNVEIFSPPYLFLPGGGAAPRPAITSAPKEVTYGQDFIVGVGTAASPGVGNITANDIESAALIRLGSVTHQFNQDQRRVPLSIKTRSIAGRSVTLEAPASGAECPPGYYMLFLMKRNGENVLTPSVAKILRVNKVSTGVVLQAIESRGETRHLTVMLAPDTQWSAAVTSGSDFITNVSITPQSKFTSTADASTAHTLSFTVAENTGQRRTGEIVIGVPNQPALNQVVTIYQGKRYRDVATDIREDTPSKLEAMKIPTGSTAACMVGFCPNDRITRAEAAVFLVRAAINAEVNPPTNNSQNVEPPPPTQVTFSDVPSTHQYYKYIEDFAKRKMTGGCGAAPPGGKPPFCPDGFVTRAELAAFTMKALGIIAPSPPPNPIYSDFTNDWAWARPMAEEATARKIMTPCWSMVGGSYGSEPPTTFHGFCPSDYATRADVANVLARLYGY